MNRLVVSPTLRRIMLEGLILCLLASAVGLSLNFRLVFNAFSGKTAVHAVVPQKVLEKAQSDPAPVYPAFPIPVELPEIDALLAEDAVLVDARSPEAYRDNHLAGAVSLPFAGLEERLAAFKERVPYSRMLIVYCSGYGCPDSFDLGVRLLKEGYEEVMVYEGGFPEWRDAGKPLERGGE